MSLVSSIARNAVQQIVGKIFVIVIGVVTVSLLTRYLGAEGFGDYTTTITFVQFFGTLADLGLYIIAMKKLSEARQDGSRVFQNILALRIVSAVVFVLLAPLTVLFFPYSATVKIGVFITTILTLTTQMNQLYVGLYQRSLAMERAVTSEVIGRVSFLALAFVLILLRAPLTVLLTSVVAGGVLQLLFNIIFAKKYIPWGLSWDPPVIREILRESWPVAVSIALNLIYFRADTIILSLFHSRATVGLYGAGYKILEVLITFPAMFAGLIMPVLAKAASQGDQERFRMAYQRSFDALATLALPIVAGVFVLAHPIIVLIAGEAFRESGTILRVLIFAVGSIFFGNLFGNAVVAIGQQRRMMPFYAGVAAFSLIGYFLFIPPFAMWGASAMTVAAEVAIMASSAFVVWRTMRHPLSLAQVGRAAIASIVMAAILYFFRSIPLFVSLLLGIGVYLAVLAGMGGLRRDEVRALLNR